MKSILLIMMVSLPVFAGQFAQDSAHGLSCEYPPDIKEEFRYSDVIFLGKAIIKEYVPGIQPDIPEYAKTKFQVIESFKGLVSDTVTVRSNERMWGFVFTENTEYVVFADEQNDHLWHQLCSPTGTPDSVDLYQIRKIAQKYVAPPLIQLNFGIPIEQIKCKEGLELISKTDGGVFCVKPQTKSKLVERGWVVDKTPKPYQNQKQTEFVVPKNCAQNVCNISVEGVILKGQPDSQDYFFVTNEEIGTISVGVLGIPLEINHQHLEKVDPHGKLVQLKGQLIREPFSSISVNEFKIKRDLASEITKQPASLQQRQDEVKKIESSKVLTPNDLFHSTRDHLGKQIQIQGTLRERNAAFAIPAMGCPFVSFEESQKFSFNDFLSTFFLEGTVYDEGQVTDMKVGIRMNPEEEYGFDQWPRLPDNLNDKKVIINGTFVPTVVSSGLCEKVVYPAGYVLTEFDQIKLVE